MTNDIQAIREDLAHLRQDVDFIKHVLSEEYELSDWAKKELEKARAAPESDYEELE